MLVRENVARIRRVKGVTKTAIAKYLGLSLQAYRYLEDGETRLDVERLKLIAKLLDVKCAVFFDDKMTDAIIDNIKNKN